MSPSEDGAGTPNGAGDPETTVLLVDDEDDFRRAAAAGLATHGFRVLQAGSAEEALDVVAEQDVVLDVVVMDVMLPDSWGPQVVFEQSFVRPDVKFIYISGYSKEDGVLRASTDHEVPFLEKPFEIGELADAIRDVLQ